MLAWWAADDALLCVLAGDGHGCVLLGLGAPTAVAALCARAVAEGGAVLDRADRATLARGTVEALDPGVAAGLGFAAEGPEWDWMWTPRPLDAEPRAAERLPLGPATVAEVSWLLARAHPTAAVAPDDDRLLGWWGVRRGGALVAAVGAMRHAPGLPPHLVSLGVDPAARGRGLAGAVLSAAVRDGLAERPTSGPRMVSLALYASNDVARRVYLRLGFRPAHRFSSRRRPLGNADAGGVGSSGGALALPEPGPAT